MCGGKSRVCLLAGDMLQGLNKQQNTVKALAPADTIAIYTQHQMLHGFLHSPSLRLKLYK
jgi:hypothetical protein